MTDPLHRLVYYSHNRMGQGAEATSSGIRDILAASRRNNARAGVTGALMFNAGCFAQVLEGPRAAVESIFERIQQDERHGDVALLGFDPAPARAFATWSMGYIGSSPVAADRYGGIARDTGFDLTFMTSDALFALMYRFAREDELAGY